MHCARLICRRLQAFLQDYRPPYDATAVRRLRDAGAIVIGKTNMDEFSMGSSTETSAYGPTRNPWDLMRTPGGSSGGSAAAVAAGIVSAALGSDTGGSVRQPAAFTGVVGLKPTYGAVSRFGLIAFASSLDQVGVFGANAHTARELFRVIRGVDPHDATSLASPIAYRTSSALTVNTDTAPLTVGLPESYWDSGVDPEIIARLDEVRAHLTRAGVRFRVLRLQDPERALAAYYVLSSAEASSNLSRFDGLRFGRRIEGRDLRDTYTQSRTSGFGTEVKRRLLLGAFVLSQSYFDEYYNRAIATRDAIRREFADSFAQVDVILTPTTPSPAFLLGANPDPVSMYRADVFTVPASLAGLPALSIPCGTTAGGLPIGLQLTGAAWHEERLLAIAEQLEAFYPPRAAWHS
jgi:aspartyl-tRNA(Asn)/glutamyl-tRNA(Gln) amidotransferase subunit A